MRHPKHRRRRCDNRWPWYWLLYLLLAGCGYEWESRVRTLQAHERVERDRAAAAWVADERPMPQACREDLARVQIAVLDDEDDVRSACLNAIAGACNREGLRAYVLFGDRELAVIVPPLTPASHAWAIRHEVLHILVSCSDVDPMLRGDENHDRVPGMWEMTDGQDSTEWRAYP